MQTSAGVSFGYRKNLERIRRMRNVTIYDFRQVHLEPLKNAMLSPVSLIDFLARNMSFISLKLTLTIVSGGNRNIIMIQSECTHRKLSFTDKKVD